MDERRKRGWLFQIATIPLVIPLVAAYGWHEFSDPLMLLWQAAHRGDPRSIQGIPPDFPLWFVIVALILMVLGVFSQRYGMRLKAKTAADLLGKDTRSPVLYLRPFDADNPSYLRMEGGSEEEHLAAVMNEIGPFVAIGRPGEALPQLGAARMYVENSEWQEQAVALMRRSQLVILRAGGNEGEGFWWEVQRSVQEVAPEQLIFLLNFGKAGYEIFRSRAKYYFPIPLPNYSGAWRLTGGLRAVLFFGRNWTPHIVKLRLPFSAIFPRSSLFRFGSPLPAALRRTLKPVLRQLGLKWKNPWRRLFAKTAITATSLILLGALLPFIFRDELLATDHLRTGNDFYGSEQFQKARSEYKEAARLKPEWPLTHVSLCMALLTTEDPGSQATESECRIAVRVAPDFPAPHAALGIWLEKKNRIADAIAEYEVASQLLPSDAQIHERLCVALVTAKKIRGAVKECETAAQLEPDNHDYAENLKSAKLWLPHKRPRP